MEEGDTVDYRTSLVGDIIEEAEGGNEQNTNVHVNTHLIVANLRREK